MPVVLDTNVLVSGALLPQSVPAKVFDRILLTDVLLFSESTLGELRSVLDRRKFQRYLDPDRRSRFLARCVEAASFVEILRRLQVCRDPDDDKFLDVAINGGADVIVSGDDDLLQLDPFEGISIVTPAVYLATRTSA